MAHKTFTRKGPDGKPVTRVAHTAAEAVQLRFEGWSEGKPEPKAPTGTTESTPKASSAGGK